MVAKLHTDQTVGSSVMNARVVTVSRVTWTSFPHFRGVGVGKGWDRYRLGHPAVEVLALVPPLNVQSGRSKVLHQGSSCAAMGPHPVKGEGIRWFSKPTPFLLAGCNRSLGYRQSRLKRRKETEGPKHQSRSKSSALPLRPERLHSFCLKELGMRHKQQHKPKTHSKNQKHKQSKNTTTTTKEKSLIPRLNQT